VENPWVRELRLAPATNSQSPISMREEQPRLCSKETGYISPLLSLESMKYFVYPRCQRAPHSPLRGARLLSALDCGRRAVCRIENMAAIRNIRARRDDRAANGNADRRRNRLDQPQRLLLHCAGDVAARHRRETPNRMERGEVRKLGASRPLDRGWDGAGVPEAARFAGYSSERVARKAGVR
jgi:hypothetical protein